MEANTSLRKSGNDRAIQQLLQAAQMPKLQNRTKPLKAEFLINIAFTGNLRSFVPKFRINGKTGNHLRG